MSNSNPKYFLRPEAGPVPFDKLQWRVQDALKNIADALGAAVDSAAAGSGGRSSSSSIDRNRASRLFFVSGEPGSGKSTLYVTLRAMLSKERYHEEYSKGYENYKGSQELQGLINRLRGEVRWLEPIDLEVVGDKEENLLAAVLVRLIRELAESSSGVSSTCDGGIKNLEELAADIGMAWESNLPARAGELDPDNYSMEVIRAQQARLRVNERLRTALDELAHNNCYGCTNSTLFVLPVDDLYLRPDASLQLLRLLRMISVPRLFFLIMGDITTIEEIFTEKALADRTSVAGAEIFQILPDRLNDALARARELRARFLRKLLPPGQRTEIQPMDWYEAMKFKPELREGEAEALGTWLAQVKLDEPWIPTDEATTTTSENSHQGNLFDFLTCRPLTHLSPVDVRSLVEQVSKLEGEKRKSHEAYTGLQLLDATPREVMDLWRALDGLIKEQEEIKKKKPENRDGNMAQTPSQDSEQDRSNSKIPLLLRVLEFVRLSVDEQNFLNEEEQSEVLYGVLPTRRYGHTPDIYLQMNRLKINESNDWKSVSKGRVWVRKHLSWRLTVNRTQETSGEFNMLPPRQTAWIVLLHDLAHEWRAGSINKNLVDALRIEVGQPVIFTDEPRNDLSAWAVIDNMRLQLPEFKTVRDLDCFLRVWNRGLDWKFPELENANRPQKSEEEARLWVSLLWAFAGWTVIEKQYHHFADRDQNWFNEGFRTDGEQESPPSSPPQSEAGLENWQQQIRGFKENSQIKKCLKRLSELQTEDAGGADLISSTTPSTGIKFAKVVLKKVCPEDSNDDGQNGEEPLATIRNGTQQSPPTTNNPNSPPEPGE